MPRLPQPGGDSGNWGQILNEFLETAHTTDGSLKPSSVSLSAFAASSGSNGQVLTLDSAEPSGFRWQTVTSTIVGDATASAKGIVQLAGDLGGSSAAPTVPGLSTKANSADVYTRAQVDTSLGTKANTADTYTRAQVDSAVATKANTADTYTRSQLYTQAETDTALSAKADAGDTYTQAEVDSAVATKANTADVYTQAEVDTALSAKANTADTYTRSQLYTQTEIDASLASVPAQFNPIAGTNVTLTGTYPDVTIAATPGAGVTDLSSTRTATNVTVVSSTGDDATLAAASTTEAGVLSAADKTKLDGVAASATANSTDAQLRDRATHTGAQPTSSVTGLDAALTSKANSADVYTQAQVDTALSGKASTATTISGAVSLTGGGDLSANRTLSLVNDAASPGNSRYYGTNGSGTKGYHDVPITSDATTGATGVVQLAGDLGGTATAPSVEKVKGVTLPASAPTSGQVLTATGATDTSWQDPAASGVTGIGIDTIQKVTQVEYDAISPRDPATLYVISG